MTAPLVSDTVPLNVADSSCARPAIEINRSSASMHDSLKLKICKLRPGMFIANSPLVEIWCPSAGLDRVNSCLLSQLHCVDSSFLPQRHPRVGVDQHSNFD
jgi:hypothetical protein